MLRRAVVILALAAVPPAAAQWIPDGAPVCTAPGHQLNPAIISDGAGGAIIAWSDGRGAGADIYVQRLTPWGTVAGGWPGNGAAASAAPGDQGYVTLVEDGAGGAVLVWTDYRNGGTNPDIYAQRLTAAGAVAGGWPRDGVPLCTASSFQVSPRSVSDGAGGALAVWIDYRNGTGDRPHIYASRVLADGRIAPGWPPAGAPIDTVTTFRGDPLLASDGAGGAIVAWSDDRNGDHDVFAQRVTADGRIAPGWPAGGVALCTAIRAQSLTSIVADGAGGAIVAWDDRRPLDGSVNIDIYAQRVTADGTIAPGWPAGGAPVCTAPWAQFFPVLAPDGAGGAIAAWWDSRRTPEANGDIFALRITAAGAIAGGWPANGLALSDDDFPSCFPGIGADGVGGAIVIWCDNRTGGYDPDIYAHRVTGSGAIAPGWAANGGVALCTAPEEQLTGGSIYPGGGLVADGAGGAIAVWTDLRKGAASQDGDVYAMRVGGSGRPGGDIPPRFRLLAPRPNPARAGDTIDFIFDLPVAGRVDAGIFDLRGRLVATLARGWTLPAGTQAVGWDGRGDGGAPVVSGVYFARVRAGGSDAGARVVVLR